MLIVFLWLIFTVGLPITAIAQSLEPAKGQFRLLDTWNLGGDGFWDYLTMDTQNHTLYVARFDRVMVVDTQTRKLVAEISGLQHAHGIALDDKGQYGYITDGGANDVVVFDRMTNQITAKIETGGKPDSIVFEPTQRRVFAFNGYTKNATVIDAGTNHVLATVPLPGAPEFSVVDGFGGVFVNIVDPVRIVRLDAKSMKVAAAWPVDGCESPSGMAIDAVHRRLFAACDNKKMAVVDSENGRLVAAPSIGEGPDAVRFDPADSLVFSSNGESGDMTVISQTSADKYSVIQTVRTQSGGRTLAYDSSNAHIYIVSAKLGAKRAPSKDNPRGRGAVVPGSFSLFVYGR
jgi:YVTN family beta-propeller protein